jgi:hypothetical protein
MGHRTIGLRFLSEIKGLMADERLYKEGRIGGPSKPKVRTKMKRKVELSDLQDLSGQYTQGAEAVEHALVALEAALSARTFPVRPDRFVEMQMRRDMPYVIHDTSEPNTQILVNRQYKLLGSTLPDGAKWVRYEDYPQFHVHLTQAEIAGVVCPLQKTGLFDDGLAPWRGRSEASGYLIRLRRLHEILTSTM